MKKLNEEQREICAQKAIDKHGMLSIDIACEALDIEVSNRQYHLENLEHPGDIKDLLKWASSLQKEWDGDFDENENTRFIDYIGNHKDTNIYDMLLSAKSCWSQNTCLTVWEEIDKIIF